MMPGPGRLAKGRLDGSSPVVVRVQRQRASSNRLTDNTVAGGRRRDPG
jgi:hypothetical protein